MPPVNLNASQKKTIAKTLINQAPAFLVVTFDDHGQLKCITHGLKPGQIEEVILYLDKLARAAER